MSKMIRTVWALIVSFLSRKAVSRTAVALTTTAVLVTPGVANATTTTDPLNGAGTSLVSSLLTNFTTYVIPAVGGVILAVYAFKMIVKLGTRFLNRA